MKASSPLTSLADDTYSYHENTRQIIGARSKKTYSIGDKVRVIVDRIDHMQRKVQFAVWKTSLKGLTSALRRSGDNRRSARHVLTIVAQDSCLCPSEPPKDIRLTESWTAGALACARGVWHSRPQNVQVANRADLRYFAIVLLPRRNIMADTHPGASPNFENLRLSAQICGDLLSLRAAAPPR